MSDFDNKQICSYKDIDRFGFTCDVCGRKVNGCHYINGMSFCEKCYQETFGKDNQQNEIQQLKQQLAEKDKLLKCYQEEEKLIADILGDKDLTLIGSRVHLKNLIVELKNKIKDKDIVIEEKDKEINQLKQEKKNAGEEKARAYLDTLTKPKIIELCLQYINDKNIAEQQLEALMLEISKQEVEQHDLPDYCTRTGTDCTNLGKIEELQRQLAEKDTRIAELEDKDWYEACIKQLEEQNDRLIGKLKEKDKEIEDWKQKTQTFLNRVNEQNYEIANNNPKQLAIQELEKVKELVKDKSAWQSPFGLLKMQESDVEQIIDQQIKELKGE